MARGERSSKLKSANASAAASADQASPAALAALPDAELLEQVQRRTFGYFWDDLEPLNGLTPDRRREGVEQVDEKAAIGGTGFGVMAIIVAVERGWITRAAAVERLGRMLDLLAGATCYHGAYPHFVNARTGATIPFFRKDDGGDLVETSFLCMGLLCARQYFNADVATERSLRGRIGWLWEEIEWDWYTQGGRSVLYWHWSANNGWAMNHEIRGWNECLITYVLAAASPRYAIDPEAYHRGFAAGRGFLNGKAYYDIELPLGMPYGGPLFFAHYSFCGLDPRGLADRYADYWEQNRRHVAINRAHCSANPQHYAGYGPDCWGLTASDDPEGYLAHAPDVDNGTLTPTAALSSLPYAPAEVMRALRHFLLNYGDRIWGRFGFKDAFCAQRNWYADSYIAIDQGPIVIMIENHRTGLLWKLFMSAPELKAALRRLDFVSPHLAQANRD
jgi:hypothetical protein